MRLPTKARFLSEQEYKIVKDIFGSRLPSRKRIIVTNAEGFGGRAFTIPLSLILIFLLSVAAFSLGLMQGLVVLVCTSLASSLNLGYVMNVGRAYSTLHSAHQSLLIHEMTHVWQGEKAFFSISYVLRSCFHQILKGKKAYSYELGKNWRKYSVEQQAQIIEDWFRSGKPEFGYLWDYVKENVRNDVKEHQRRDAIGKNA